MSTNWLEQGELGCTTAWSRRSRRKRRRGRVLTLAWMNREALERTVETRRSALLVALAQEAVAQGRRVRPCAESARDPARLRRGRDPARVEQAGGIACHTGQAQLFFPALDDGAVG